MTIVTHTTSVSRMHVIYDDGKGQIARYSIHFEGREHVVTANAGESPEEVWQRMLTDLAVMRMVVRNGNWPGDHMGYASVYAGIQPTEEQKKGHIRDWISFNLFHLADPYYNKDAKSRVDALVALIDLHGLARPPRSEWPTLAELDAEIARSKVKSGAMEARPDAGNAIGGAGLLRGLGNRA